MEVIEIATSKIIPYARNPRHNADAVDTVAASIAEFGWRQPIVVNPDMVVLVGHTRLMAAKKLGLETVPVHIARDLTPQQERAYRLMDNRSAENATWDNELLALDFEELLSSGYDLKLTGFDDEELNGILKNALKESSAVEQTTAQDAVAKLEEGFGVPPFSVLDARKGAWLERKRAWEDRICDKGETREGTLFAVGKKDPVSQIIEEAGGSVSILDAVLSELVVRWFGVPGGLAIDPFAGDSVFGYVAGSCGMRFEGVELRQDQRDLNAQRTAHLPCIYHCGDAANLDDFIADGCADLVFSCPPYGSLEVYSTNPADLSTMKPADFLESYSQILAKLYRKLKDDRFAVIVVGESRDKDGAFIGQVHGTITAMIGAGFRFWNSIVLLTPLGSACIRARRPMMANRKVATVHQHVLVFLKGDAKRAVASMGDIEGFLDLSEDQDDADTR